MTPQKTVKVKIAVVIDDEGNWTANGWNDGEKECMGICLDIIDIIDGDVQRFWVEAELPIPKIKTFSGTVEEEIKS